jgi:hypothetical protein
MRKDGFPFFSFNPHSLDKHESKVHPKSFKKLTLLGVFRLVLVMGLAIFLIIKAKNKEGTIKAEYQTDEYLKETSVDFNFPMHNFMVIDDPDFKQKIGESMWKE